MVETKSSPAFTLVGLSDIKRQPINDWQKFLEEGNQFLATASKAYDQNRSAFTTEILYNLVAMAVEKLIMALLMKSGNLPYNHTMHDLVHSMEEFLPGRLTHHLGEELRRLDAFQEICDPEKYTISAPSMAEVGNMLELAKKMQTITLSQISHQSFL